VTLESAPGVGEAAKSFLREQSIPGSVLILGADRAGLVKN
jgi:hypothetical protein